MLNPHSRHVYLEMLKPPTGFTLDRAVGTTFSLDLETLLAVPLGFAMLDWENAKGELSLDPVALLHALRRCADRVTVFCQAGRITAPAKHHPLFAYLEGMIAEVHAPNESGVFHAKTWLLRFKGKDGVLYRFICLSRNLTHDRSWDTVLVLDGMLTDRERAFSRNHPLGDFIAALPEFVRRELNPERQKALEVLADEVRRVKFELPEDFDEVTFWPIGIPNARKFPLDDRIDRLLVVSPFVSDGFLHRRAELAPTTIVSRPDSLEELSLETLEKLAAAYVLEDAAVEEDVENNLEDAGNELTQPNVRGLHAKLFIADQGWDASVWTGSANATDAAFGRRNIEFLVQLGGRKSKAGIDSFLGENEGGFKDFLRAFEVSERRPHDADIEGNEDKVEAARRRIARTALALRVEPASEPARYHLTLYATGELPNLEDVNVRCWPVTLRTSLRQSLANLAEGALRFPDLTVHALTSFMTFEVAAGAGAKRVVSRFALNLPLEGAPDDRLDQILSAVLGNGEQLLRYLMFLLAQDEDTAVGAPELLLGASGMGTNGTSAQGASIPLFEELVRAVARSPEKLDAVHHLVKDLRRTSDGAALLPEGFDDIWAPIWRARLARKETST